MIDNKLDDMLRPDALVIVNGHVAKLAFEKWRSNWDRPENLKSQLVPREFAKMIASRLDTKYAIDVQNLGLPLSNAAWSRFKNSTAPRRLRIDICWQIFFLDGVDVTANKELTSYPLNSTDMVTLGRCQMKPADHEGAEHLVSVEWIDFQSTDEKEILKSDAMENPTNHGDELTIGVVRYVLRKASLSISNCSSIKTHLMRIGDGRSTENGSADGVELSLDPSSLGRWRIERPIDRPALQGRLDNLTLADITPSSESAAQVIVSASISDVFPDITLTDDTISRTDNTRLRRQLVNQIMRNRLRDAGIVDRFVLSIAHLST